MNFDTNKTSTLYRYLFCHFLCDIYFPSIRFCISDANYFPILGLEICDPNNVRCCVPFFLVSIYPQNKRLCKGSNVIVTVLAALNAYLFPSIYVCITSVETEVWGQSVTDSNLLLLEFIRSILSVLYRLWWTRQCMNLKSINKVIKNQ